MYESETMLDQRESHMLKIGCFLGRYDHKAMCTGRNGA